MDNTQTINQCVKGHKTTEVTLFIKDKKWLNWKSVKRITMNIKTTTSIGLHVPSLRQAQTLCTLTLLACFVSFRVNKTILVLYREHWYPYLWVVFCYTDYPHNRIYTEQSADHNNGLDCSAHTLSIGYTFDTLCLSPTVNVRTPTLHNKQAEIMKENSD